MRTANLMVVILAFVALTSCEKTPGNNANNPPAKPTAPEGPTSGYTGRGYIYTTTSTDPDGDSIAARFDWGDGTISDWTQFVPSGVGVGKGHTYTEGGTYQIRAQVKDTHGNLSEWSEPTTVVIEFFPFAMTQNAYPDGSDLVAAVQSELGTDYTIADWNDVKNWCESHSAGEFIDLLGWELGEENSLLVLRDGEGYWNGRHYYISRFDHDPPAGYLIHDQIDDNHIVLGSWSPVSFRVLAIKR